MQTFKNPVLAGFSPDPSVCAVGDDYYLVTSTFSYFPGVPIYHSKDLVNWTQIGNVLDREEQLNLTGLNHSEGIFAPTLRYHDGTFYMITTNVPHGGNFVVTATDPAGPWSNPYFIDNAPGIDPSLYFDDDGKCYYVGTREDRLGAKYNGDWEVWLQEFDLETMQLTGVSTAIWKGALKDAIWPEGPHIYKKDGYYYVMIAEGGTSFNHAVTIARSKSIDGPYVGNKNNPILTHRHLGSQFPVHNVGHADLVETPDGKWYMTCLAVRPIDGYSNMGRETFLAEVIWEDDWPVVNPGAGRLLEEQEHALPLQPVKERETFDLTEDNPSFLHLRNPDVNRYDSESREGWLRVFPNEYTLKDKASPIYRGLRQSAASFTLSTRLEEHLTDKSEAGLALIQSNEYAVRLVLVTSGGDKQVQFISTSNGEDRVIGLKSVDSSEMELTIEVTGLNLKASFKADNEEVVVVEDADIHHLSPEVAGGFVGCTMGIYATSLKDDGHADFNYLKLINHS
ncbi:glycoside hydrolase family 43 protein [Alkalibacterium sp. MB6]|uniref:glycoside hydrolase family 43 protein n=1 Tax=Alkalibacterium sp. MB6 TaxID=2081965 RepID=UPI00137A848C|nr:glycoside hydrolase family 43 protein [Alkalibacterium sp. MB6]